MAATARFQSRDQSSTDMLLAALDGAAVGVWLADLVSNTVVQSDTVGPLFGLPRGPAHSTLEEWRASILPEDLDAAVAAFDQASRTDGRFSADYRVRWPDGTIRWLTATGRIDRGPDGAPVRAVGILKDSTARKEAEEALVRRTQELAQSEAQYRMMGEAIPYGVWLCDAEGQARYVSPSFRELLEMSQEEQAGFGWTRRYDPTVVKAMMDRWMYCVRTGEPWEWEHRLLGPDKEYHTVLSRGVPVRDDEGRISSWVGVNLDITDRKRAENEVLRKNDELQRLVARIKELDEARSTFFANVSHELRTPLALILGPVDKLLREGAVDAAARDELRVVRRNAATLLKQVNALLDLSKVDAGKMALNYVHTDLAELVRVVAGHFDGLARQQGIDFRVEAPSKLLGDADAEKVERIVLNLLSNAFKYAPAQGRIACSLHQGENEALITVSDNGPGIPSEDRDRIFQRFRRGHSTGTQRQGGTGLGLAIAKDFVELHRGTIHIEDTPGGGATFKVCLPLQAPADATVAEASGQGVVRAWSAEVEAARNAAPTVELPSSPVDDGRPTVLVVEDNDDLRRYLLAALGRRWRVAAARDGMEGLAQAKAAPPDVIVTDLMMPRMSGDQMIAALREDDRTRDTPVVVLSAKADDPLRLHLLAASVQDYLVKPFADEELLARVANLMTMKRARDILQAGLDSAHRDIERLAEEVTVRNRDLKSAAEAMRVARDHAYEALAARTTFLRLMSHELRTPLAAMELQVALLRRQDGMPPPQRTAVDNLGRTVDRLSRMIEEVLTLSRAESGRLKVERQVFDLRAMAEATLADFRPAAEAKGLAVTLMAPTEAAAFSDPALVGLVLRNLVDNAIKYTPSGNVEVALDREADGWRIAVSDTGCGIPVDAQARIFEPFVQLEDVRHKHTPGVGLGLALARHVAQSLGGTLQVNSEPGKGSIFAFTFRETRKED